MAKHWNITQTNNNRQTASRGSWWRGTGASRKTGNIAALQIEDHDGEALEHHEKTLIIAALQVEDHDREVLEQREKPSIRSAALQVEDHDGEALEPPENNNRSTASRRS